MKYIIILLLLLFFAVSCKNKSTEKDKSENKTETKKVYENSSLKHYDIENEGANFVKLHDLLTEVSGICITDDGRMFAHGDEDADIFEIDSKTGEVKSVFYVNDPEKSKDRAMGGDFEDIAWAGNRFFLVKNNGTLYEFSEGKKGEVAAYKEYKTKLTSSNDVEGLCYDNATNSLLLVCKGNPGEGIEDKRAVYSFDLKTMTLNESPRFLIATDDAPSGITMNSKTGTFYIIAARGNRIWEIDKNGEVIGEKKLPKKVHLQPEGIAIGKDQTLYISNEGKDKEPRLVSYTYNP